MVQAGQGGHDSQLAQDEAQGHLAGLQEDQEKAKPEAQRLFQPPIRNKGRFKEDCDIPDEQIKTQTAQISKQHYQSNREEFQSRLQENQFPKNRLCQYLRVSVQRLHSRPGTNLQTI